MSLKHLNWKIMLLILVLVLGALLGGQKLYLDHYLAPNLARSLNQVEGLDSFELTGDGLLTVQFSAEADFVSAYQKVASLTYETYGPQKAAIRIENTAGEDLAAQAADLNLIIAQVIRTQEFSLLEVRLKELAGENNLDAARAVVDGDNLYLELKKGDAAFYQVTPLEIESGDKP